MNLVYAGKLGGWYPTREMVHFFATAKPILRGLHWRVFTQSDPTELRERVEERGLGEDVTIGRVPPEELPAELHAAHVGLCLYQRRLSGPACSPTKIAEYLAAGLPVVASAGIGDTDAVLTWGSPGESGEGHGDPVGVLIPDTTEESYHQATQELQKLLDDPDTPRRCRAVAEEQFDLERIGWARYRQIYESLIGRPVPAQDPVSTELKPVVAGAENLNRSRGK